MLANLKGLFTPEAIAASMKTMPPLETTIMDNEHITVRIGDQRKLRKV